MDQEFRGSSSLLRADCEHRRNSNILGEWKGCSVCLGNVNTYKEVLLQQVAEKSKSFNGLETSGINGVRHQLSVNSSSHKRTSFQHLSGVGPNEGFVLSKPVGGALYPSSRCD
ncbi:hypothetical protein L1049_022121 [Liquidambar formosana]|uniref:Uncharacterized protein n=1 Tax=Liquidambar formosana TaxID=63359 RepID=A0AAP0WNH0_LIQFO